jgi:hypothetical protein
VGRKGKEARTRGRRRAEERDLRKMARKRG